MANLGPQHINQSFGDLLQLPNGLTPAIQNVQDGSGNVTPLEISTTAVDLPIVGPDGAGMLSDLGGASGSNFIGFEQAGAGAVTRSVQDKTRETVSVLDFGAVGDGSTDDTTAITNTDTAHANNFAPVGTYKITNTITLNQNNKITGDGELITVIQNAGSGTAVQTPVSTPGGPKSYTQGMFNFQINGVNAGSPAAAALTVQQTGNTYWEKGILQNHQTGVMLEGAVGTTLRNISVMNTTNGVKAGGVSMLDAVTITNFDSCSFTSNTTAIVNNGFNKAFHFNETIFEANTNVYSEASGSPMNMVFRNNWFESNANFDFGTANNPLIDSSYFAGDYTITGGWAPRILNATVNGATNWPTFKVTSEIADVSVTGQTFGSTNTGQHGIHLQMPVIGAASTPVDRYGAQESRQSQLFANIGSPIVACGVGFQNLIAADPTNSGFWSMGSANATGGQADIFGGTSAVLVNGVGAYLGTSNISTIPSEWYVVQAALRASSAGNEVGFWAQSWTTGTLDKRMYYTLPDTEWRVVHFFFKADDNTTRLFFLHGGGMIVQRIVMAQGAILRPFVPYNANIPNGFWMEFNSIVSYGSAAPASGTWRVGDRVLNSAPASAGFIGWVCTTAGTPDTWNTYGLIS